ncbi:MAG: hypothetical protein CL908_23930 [Deltaproteobacteria bacterium]|nr:hypothetical protein [Deltaproteobacteria bacterium]
MIEFCFETINWSPYLWNEVPGLAPPKPAQMIEAAASAGFAWISFDQTLLDAHGAAGGSLEDLRRWVDDAGLKVLALHSSALGEDPRAASAAARLLAEAVPVLGAPWVQVGATAPLGSALFEATHAAASILGAVGARLAIEFLPFLEVASIADARTLVAATEDHRTAIVADSWHFFHGPDDWDTLRSLAADEIAFVQFDDHPPLESDDLLEETTQRRVHPGRGEFDLGRFAKTLRASGFDGVVGLEQLSAADRIRPVEQVARELMAAARPYWIED